MKKSTHPILSTLSLLVTGSLQAAFVVDIDNSSFNLGTSTATIFGDEGEFKENATHDRWLAVADSGTTNIGTTSDFVASPTTGKTDYYWQSDAGGGAPSVTVPLSGNFYLEVNYTLSGGWIDNAGTGDDRLAIDSTSGSTSTGTINSQFKGDSGAPALDSDDIANSNGSHSFILDLTNDVSSGRIAGNINLFRWDMFNNANNTGGKVITLESITFSNSITAVPEPTSATLLGLGALGFLSRRRR